MHHRLVGMLVVALVLVGLSFLNDPGGYLGTDTGGKTATLEAMVDRGDWSLDVGYWAAEHDPDGTFHPMFGTTRTDEGWIQVTSMPMILAARPLYDVGGYRAALLLPIAGTVLAALAAAALAERLGDRHDGTRAFWIFGLGSPLVIYGLDLWEHSLGVAAVGWAVVLLLDVAAGAHELRALGAGALFAAAATMRTEALVYALVIVGVLCFWLLASRRVARSLLMGGAAVVGFAPIWLANSALENALGGNSRTSRAAGAASGGGSELGLRLEEGIRTTVATSATDAWAPVVLGVLLTVAVAAAVGFGDRIPRDRRRLVVAGLGAFTVLTVVSGFGFVPGLVAAFPVAAAAGAWNRVGVKARVLVVAGVVALPVVWAFQFVGGAGPQWAGRYALTSTLLFGVVGVVAIGARGVPRSIAATVVAMCVAVTAFGVAWLWDRSHDVAQLFDVVVAVQDDALIARNKFFLRESGPLVLEQQWLSAVDPSDLEGPAEVLRLAGVREFSVLQLQGQPPPDVDGATVMGVDRTPALGVVFEVVHLRFEP